MESQQQISCECGRLKSCACCERTFASSATAAKSKSTTTAATTRKTKSITTSQLGRSNLLMTVFLVILITGCALVAPGQRVEGAKTLKKIVKEVVFSQLTQRKNILPVPLPIPVPIELNEPPVYIKGKPKYVNVYKSAPRPTPQPVIKPTTVYHMPVYSPTYESYMAMDPMSVYAGSAMANMYPSSLAEMYGAGAKMKSSVNTDSESTGSSFNDYDDESGNYYVRKSAAAKRRRYAAAAASDYDATLSRADDGSNEDDNETAASTQQQQHDFDRYQQQEQDFITYHNMIAAAADEHQRRMQIRELMDYEDDVHNYQTAREAHTRTKRQVYYQSGYNGQERCFGFPLEINVRSRIKMDRLFPIHGKSQIKKCIPVGKPLLPPVEDHDNY